MKKALVVGSGAGGATVARELQGTFQVTVLEAGHSFRPFSRSLSTVEGARKAGLLFNEREISWVFPNMMVRKASGGMVLVNGVGEGGTTTLSAGNAIRCDGSLKAIGIDLDREFEELYREVPVSTDHERKWREPTRSAYRVARQMGLDPFPTPKLVRTDRCVGCGRCVLGCPLQAKWDSREYLEEAAGMGAQILTGWTVRKIVIENGRATGVVGVNGWRTCYYPADLVVLAAGGLGTPLILQQSGIAVEARLSVDPVLCVAAPWSNAGQDREMPMPFIVQGEHYIVSPYFDFLSFFFNRSWKHPSGDIFSLMIKLADTNDGTVGKHHIYKRLSETDRSNLRQGVALCTEIFSRLGKKPEELFFGTVNAGHPAGTLPLTAREAMTLHSSCLPPNVYVADASLLPQSLGNPAILTIAALAKRIASVCKQHA